jgi:hypothetical protein
MNEIAKKSRRCLPLLGSIAQVDETACILAKRESPYVPL